MRSSRERRKLWRSTRAIVGSKTFYTLERQPNLSVRRRVDALETALEESSRRLDTILSTMIRSEEEKAAVRELELRIKTDDFLQKKVDTMKKML